MSELKEDNGKWFKVDNILVDKFAREIGITSFAIYVVLKKHRNLNGLAWPTMKQIARKLGISQRTVLRHIRRLEDYGLIERNKDRWYGRWENCSYYFPDRDLWDIDPYDKLSNLVDHTYTQNHMTNNTDPYDNSLP